MAHQDTGKVLLSCGTSLVSISSTIKSDMRSANQEYGTK